MISHLSLLVYHFQYVDLVPYIVFLGLLFVIMALDETVKSRVILMTIVVLLFTCFRYDIGYDYGAYKRIALGLNNDEFERVEFFDKVLLSIAMFTDLYQLFFIATSLIIYIPISWFCLKHSRDPELSILVYLFYPFMFLESMSAVRNYMAFSMVLIALSMIMRNRIRTSLVWIVVAFGFHLSALFALLLIPVYKIRLNKMVLWGMWIGSFLMTIVLERYLSNVQSDNYFVILFLKYVDAKQQGGQIFTYLLNLICLVVLLLWDRLKMLKEGNDGLLRLIIVGGCIWNLLAFDFVTRSRLSMYFLLPLLLIIPEFKEIIEVKGLQIRRVLIYVLFAIFSSSFFINIKANLDNGTKISYLPYQTFISHVDYERNE